MKKKRKRIRSNLLEALGELVLGLLCFGIGALIFRLFGGELDASFVDFDLLVLIGIVALCLAAGVVYALIRCLGRKSKRKGKENTLPETNEENRKIDD